MNVHDINAGSSELCATTRHLAAAGTNSSLDAGAIDAINAKRRLRPIILSLKAVRRMA